MKLLAQYRNSMDVDAGIVAEGEQIYAIQYRKIKFGLFSPKKMEEAYLKRGKQVEGPMEDYGCHASWGEGCTGGHAS